MAYSLLGNFQPRFNDAFGTPMPASAAPGAPGAPAPAAPGAPNPMMMPPTISGGGLGGLFRNNPSTMMALAAGFLGGRNPNTGGYDFGGLPQARAIDTAFKQDQSRKMALTGLMTSPEFKKLTPEERAYFVQNPDAFNAYMAKKLAPQEQWVPITDPAERKAAGIPENDISPYQKNTLTGETKRLAGYGNDLSNSGINSAGKLIGDLPEVTIGKDGLPDTEAQQAFLGELAKTDPMAAKELPSILNYQVDLTKSASMRGGRREYMAALASAADPTFNMGLYSQRQSMMKNMTQGDYAKSMNAAKLVIQHLDLVKKAGDRLDNGGFKAINAADNWLAGQAPGLYKDDKVKALAEFQTEKQGAIEELAKVFKGTGATNESEINAWNDTISAAQSPEQMHAAINAALDMLGKRLEVIHSQYQNVMGKPAHFTFLTGKERQALTDIGYDPGTLDPNEAAASPDAAPDQPAPSAPSIAPPSGDGWAKTPLPNVFIRPK